MKIEIEKIRLDGGTQTRAGINEDVVNDYSMSILSGGTFPEITLFFDGLDYWLADGFHRTLAHERAGIKEVAADIKQGTRRDAVLFSVGANSSHGLRRTNADKRRAVETLLSDDEWAKWSDREIARRAGVHHSFVSRLRDDMSLSISDSDRTYTTKHGTVATMQTANIGAVQRHEQQEIIDTAPILTPAQQRIEERKEVFFKASENIKPHTPKPIAYNLDVVDFLDMFDDSSVDLIVTDPPYLTDVDDIESFVKRWVPLMLSKLKTDGRAYVFTGAYPREAAAYYNVLNNSGFNIDPPLIWLYKNSIGPSSKLKYKTNYQLIWHLYTEDSSPLASDILIEKLCTQEFNAPDGRFGDRVHAWQKPDSLIRRLIMHAGQNGEGKLLIDPFTCTGTSLINGAIFGYECIGSDISLENLKIAQERGVLVV